MSDHERLDEIIADHFEDELPCKDSWPVAKRAEATLENLTLATSPLSADEVAWLRQVSTQG